MPYTIQMKHLYEQVRKGKADWGRGSFADFSRVEPDLLKKYQYHWEFYEKLGKDAARDRFESGITWHMSAGGVRVNVETMETGVPGLFVAGAVGAHMLGGLPHSTYDGLIAAASAVRYAAAHPKPAPDSAQVRRQEDRVGALLAGAGKGGGISPIEAKTRVRAIVWDNLMFQKNGQTLRRALVELDEARRDLLPKLRLRTATSRYNVDLMDALDLEDMIDVSEMSARASLAREESRGPHFREDFPYTDNENWLKWVVVSRKGGKVDIRTEPVPQKYVAPKQKRVDYLADPYA
jgi:succinate dehydrogenase/fumarate reductase flavoprotein subunit